jgi:hypothetical protein
MTRKTKLGFYSFMAALDISILAAAYPEHDTVACGFAGFALTCFTFLLIGTLIDE